MAKLPDLVARIRLDTSALDRASGQVNAHTTGMSKGFGRLGTAAKLGLAAAGVALAKFGKDAVSAASESRKILAQTEAVLKSTGGAANVSAKHIGTLTSKLQKLSGVQDESIQAGANMLLTFTKIRNGVGKGNDIFDQATKTLLDMSVALGTDAKTSAIQLGKALNDPARGVTALTKVGVTFTAQQKEQIKELAGQDTAIAKTSESMAKNRVRLSALTEAGKGASTTATTLRGKIANQEESLRRLNAEMKDGGGLMKAQKIILAELATEFGGSAKAAGDARTPMEKLKLVFEDMQEAIGEKLLVVLDRLSAWFKEHGPFLTEWARLMGERVAFLGEWFRLMGEKVAGWGRALYNAGQTLVDAQDAIGGFFYDVWQWAGKAAKAVGDLLDKLNNIPGLSVGKSIGKGIGGLLGKIPGFATGGVVPGPIGAPQLAVVHGGETVTPPGKGGVSVTQNIYNGSNADENARAIAWAMR